MNRPFDLLVFDWDGTVCNSAAPIVASFQRAITLLQLPPRRDEEIRRLIGLGGADALRRLYPDVDPVPLIKALRETRATYMPAGIARAPLFPGTQEALESLYREGYPMAIATGKLRANLEESLDAFPHLRALFRHSRCADETADKPHPRMLLELLDAFGVAPGRALMIGDTSYDMEMAAAAGMARVAVSCGVHEVPLLQDAGADAVIEDISRLPAWLGEVALRAAPIPPGPAAAAG